MTTETTAPNAPIDAEAQRLELFQRSQQGDWQADQQLLDLEKGRLRGQVAKRALEGVELHVRETIWQQHAESFGLDPADAEVRAAIEDAKDFKTLNRALLALAKDDDLIETVANHPKVQERATTARAKAQEAQAQAAKAAAGPTPGDILAEYLEARQNRVKLSPEKMEQVRLALHPPKHR